MIHPQGVMNMYVLNTMATHPGIGLDTGHAADGGNKSKEAF